MSVYGEAEASSVSSGAFLELLGSPVHLESLVSVCE